MQVLAGFSCEMCMSVKLPTSEKLLASSLLQTDHAIKVRKQQTYLTLSRAPDLSALSIFSSVWAV